MSFFLQTWLYQRASKEDSRGRTSIHRQLELRLSFKRVNHQDEPAVQQSTGEMCFFSLSLSFPFHSQGFPDFAIRPGKRPMCSECKEHTTWQLCTVLLLEIKSSWMAATVSPWQPLHVDHLCAHWHVACLSEVHVMGSLRRSRVILWFLTLLNSAGTRYLSAMLSLLSLDAQCWAASCESLWRLFSYIQHSFCFDTELLVCRSL